MMKPTTIMLILAILASYPSKQYIPSSIKYSVQNDNHVYIISGIHPSKKNETFRYEEHLAKNITGCIEARVSVDNDQLTLICGNRLIDLKAEMNKLIGYGWFAGWDELVTRDKRSKNYDSSIYRKVMEKDIKGPNVRVIVKHEIYPDGSIGLFFNSGIWGEQIQKGFGTLSEYKLIKSDNEYKLLPEVKEYEYSLDDIQDLMSSYNNPSTRDSIEIQFKESRKGTLILNIFTEYCMCYKWYALRLFIETGEFIWEDPSTLCGGIKIIPHDMDNDKIEEIIIYSSAHEDRRIIVYDND